jgi:hypothetical protein
MKEHDLIPTEDELLQEVRDFKSGIMRNATWYEYEEFKQKFLNHGYYGWESKIADILEI